MDFFFIDEVGFSLRSRVVMLSVMLEACQHFFKFFTKSYSRKFAFVGKRPTRKAAKRQRYLYTAGGMT